MIVGTAGHIDHGKTALVKALTGVDADRLPEEKARGITIDLGYAYSPTRGGGMLGFVDVPGHERLVHNMLAGATGIDYMLLAVAADDGPMPQTREHVQILDLLGVQSGAVALTKVDAVEPDRVHEAAAEVRGLLRGSAFEHIPMVHVSSITGAGVTDLRALLEAAASSLPGRARAAHFRLAIDRCFTLKGVGTIVTGTVFSGSVRVGDELMLSPPGVIVRVRGIHAQDQPAEEGRAGQRCALNLRGQAFDKAQVERGMWALDARVHAPTQRIDAQLRLLASELRTLKHWTPVHFHLGANDVTGRVALLEGEALEPGATALGQIVLDHPLGALGGDRFVIRDQSATRTMGGGVVIDPFAPRRARRATARIALLRESAATDPRAALDAALALSQGGVDLHRFETVWNLPHAQSARLFDASRLRRIDAGEASIGFSEAGWEALKQRIVAVLAAEHRRVPDMIGVGRERLRRLTDPALVAPAAQAAIEELLHDQEIRQSGAWLHRPDHHVRLTANEEKLWLRVHPLLEAALFHPPRVRDVADTLHEEEGGIRRLLRHAARLGHVYPVARDHYFAQRGVMDLAQIVRELNETAGAAAASAFRDRIGTGRKLAIQILEFFDRVGFTRRVGDAHVLRQPGLFEKTEAHIPGGMQ